MSNNNDLNMVISKMDAIKDNLLYNKVYSILDKQDQMWQRMNKLEDKLDLIIKILNDSEVV